MTTSVQSSAPFATPASCNSVISPKSFYQKPKKMPKTHVFDFRLLLRFGITASQRRLGSKDAICHFKLWAIRYLGFDRKCILTFPTNQPIQFQNGVDGIVPKHVLDFRYVAFPNCSASKAKFRPNFALFAPCEYLERGGRINFVSVSQLYEFSIGSNLWCT